MTVQATARKMVEAGNGGRIVCLASLAAENTGGMMWSYSATKAGVRMMVRGLLVRAVGVSCGCGACWCGL